MQKVTRENAISPAMHKVLEAMALFNQATNLVIETYDSDDDQVIEFREKFADPYYNFLEKRIINTVYQNLLDLEQ